MNEQDVIAALPGTVLDVLRHLNLSVTGDKKRVNCFLYDLEKKGKIIKDQPDPRSKPIWRSVVTVSGNVTCELTVPTTPTHVYRVFYVNEPEDYLGFSTNEDEARRMAEQGVDYYTDHNLHGEIVVQRIKLDHIKLGNNIEHHETVYIVGFE